MQAPQDYRDWQHARYYRRLYYSYKYFFAVSQPSRNERDGAIFAGTVGLIRRVALDELGGWDEWCITEDAEVSLRLLRAGWSGMHVDESGGRGIMPLTFEALKAQRYRWCFGGIQLLRMHWKSLLPGDRDEEEPPVGRPALVVPVRRAAVVRRPARPAVPDLPAGRRGEPGDRRRTAPLQADGLPRRRCPSAHPARPGPRHRAAAPQHRRDLARRPRRVFIWQSTSLVVARASVLALFAKKAAFLRTPKTSERTTWWHALRANWAESILALCGAAGRWRAHQDK